MCGIIGINKKDEQGVREAAQAFRYRGPDAFGIFADEHMTLGHNRLAIIDLDSRAEQPFFDASGQVGIVFNGEIYNFRELRAELERTGRYTFRTTSDTEVLLYAYQEWGEEVVVRLRGMFAFAIYNTVTKKIILVSDVSAIKPLYYSNADGVFAFASEMKGVLALLKKRNHAPKLDRDAVDLYFAYGYIPAPRTLYRTIRRLPPRTIAVYDCSTDTFAERTYEVLPTLDARKNTDDDIAAVITSSVQAHLVADVPVGIFFSGGTDSSLLAALVQKAGVPVETFSMAVEGRTMDRPYFDAIAKELGITAHTMHFDRPVFEKTYQEVLVLLDEPLADNSLLPTYALAQYAASRIKVVLSGEGGDEFFYGYPRSLVLRRLNASGANTFGFIERLYLMTPSFKGKNSLFEKLFVFCSKPLSYYLSVMSPARDLLTSHAWKTAHAALHARNIAPDSYDAEWYLPNDLLRKTDLATMYASIEGRVPLVDREVIEAARFVTPASDSKELKPVLKRILSKYISRSLVYRKKSGFGLHLPTFFATSEVFRSDLDSAIQNLREQKLLPLKRIPPVSELMHRYPNLAWAIIVLDRVIRNNSAV